ncbi:MAG: SDR family oxidoreductase [Phyllobacteriaceae bacterium]|jgi:NAD(P)-dependent dehydrogenase (short-subunit alcohol dehydrogenase family)|nr:SDR family oxidoreductase [Phyllobacteriaceae bacterium]
MTLDGRHVLVTGAARGLGAVLARVLADAGARLVLADIAEEEGRAVAADVGGHFLPVDLADPASIDALGQAVAAHTGGVLHGLVNNGAIATNVGGKTFEEIEIETWDRVMGVNVRGTWLMVRAMAPLLRASGSGRIVNVASDTAIWGAPKLLSYVASKGAVISMTRSLARELGPDSVGVTAIAPGILTTPSTDYVPEARHRHYADGRAVPGPHAPEEVADTVAFLLGGGALSLTGQVLPVNKGFVFG